MNRMLIMTATLLVAFGLTMGVALSNEPMVKGWNQPYEISNLVGTPVSNTKGEVLGRIDEFVIDQGRISFAVLAHGGFLRFGEKRVAVPFSALSYDQGARHFVLDITKEKLDSAPAFDLGSYRASRQWAEDVYKYYGQQPYWTEGGMKSSTESPMKEKGMMEKGMMKEGSKMDNYGY